MGPQLDSQEENQAPEDIKSSGSLTSEGPCPRSSAVLSPYNGPWEKGDQVRVFLNKRLSQKSKGGPQKSL